MDLESFNGLDPAFTGAAKEAQESWKPAETIPTFRLDTVAFRGATFYDKPDADLHFHVPIVIGSQAVLGYDDSRNPKYDAEHQVMLVRNSTRWIVKEDRRLFLSR